MHTSLNSEYYQPRLPVAVNLPPRMFNPEDRPVMEPQPEYEYYEPPTISYEAPRYHSIQNQSCNEPTIYNTYDPRSESYGLSTRLIYNPMLDLYEYDYSHIDNMLMENPARNNIDMFMPTAPGDYSLSQVRPMVERKYLDDSLSFREDLMKSKMSGYAARDLQKRMYPMRR